MADVERLRDKIIELAVDPLGPLRGKFNPNDLYSRISRLHNGDPPVGRATFYAWFGQREKPARQALLECVPAFAKILGVHEYELWQTAGILPSQMKASLALAASADNVRDVNRRLQATLSESGLSTAGETTLLIDRILHAQLDYHLEIWPVVRGETKPLHLHSWIILKPVADSGSRRRLRTVQLEAGDSALRRRFIREEVIGQDLWSTLGLKWRDKIPESFGDLGQEPLFIEVPVEERNRVAPEEVAHPRLQVDRILVLGAPWAHAELLVALIADALRFGSSDLRYLGLPPGQENAGKERFCRERLADCPERHIWAIAQRSDMMEGLRSDIVRAAESHLVIIVTYGPAIALRAANALGTRPYFINRALDQLTSIADELEENADVIRVHIEDADVVVGASDGVAGVVDPHVLADRVRYLAAWVLNALYEHRYGPGIQLWGDRFEALRHGAEARARIPFGTSSVGWMPRVRD